MDLTELIQEKKEELHIHEFGFCKTKDLFYSKGVRDLCEMNSCGFFGSTWACPPGVGTIEECKAQINQYENVFVYTTLHPLEDSYDFEGMMAGRDAHCEYGVAIRKFINEIIPGKKLFLSNEGCSLCAKCTYPDAPCRFPESLSPSIEAYGVEVNRLAKTVNIHYINGANTVTYFGCVLF